MYFQFLIEDRSTEILVHHIMKKIQRLYPDKEILVRLLPALDI